MKKKKSYKPDNSHIAVLGVFDRPGLVWNAILQDYQARKYPKRSILLLVFRIKGTYTVAQTIMSSDL